MSASDSSTAILTLFLNLQKSLPEPDLTVYIIVLICGLDSLVAEYDALLENYDTLVTHILYGIML